MFAKLKSVFSSAADDANEAALRFGVPLLPPWENAATVGTNKPHSASAPAPSSYFLDVSCASGTFVEPSSAALVTYCPVSHLVACALHDGDIVLRGANHYETRIHTGVGRAAMTTAAAAPSSSSPPRQQCCPWTAIAIIPGTLWIALTSRDGLQFHHALPEAALKCQASQDTSHSVHTSSHCEKLVLHITPSTKWITSSLVLVGNSVMAVGTTAGTIQFASLRSLIVPTSPTTGRSVQWTAFEANVVQYCAGDPQAPPPPNRLFRKAILNPANITNNNVVAIESYPNDPNALLALLQGAHGICKMYLMEDRLSAFFLLPVNVVAEMNASEGAEPGELHEVLESMSVTAGGGYVVAKAKGRPLVFLWNEQSAKAKDRSVTVHLVVSLTPTLPRAAPTMSSTACLPALAGVSVGALPFRDLPCSIVGPSAADIEKVCHFHSSFVTAADESSSKQREERRHAGSRCNMWLVGSQQSAEQIGIIVSCRLAHSETNQGRGGNDGDVLHEHGVLHVWVDVKQKTAAATMTTLSLATDGEEEDEAEYNGEERSSLPLPDVVPLFQSPWRGQWMREGTNAVGNTAAAAQVSSAIWSQLLVAGLPSANVALSIRRPAGTSSPPSATQQQQQTSASWWDLIPVCASGSISTGVDPASVSANDRTTMMMLDSPPPLMDDRCRVRRVTLHECRQRWERQVVGNAAAPQPLRVDSFLTSLFPSMAPSTPTSALATAAQPPPQRKHDAVPQLFRALPGQHRPSEALLVEDFHAQGDIIVSQRSLLYPAVDEAAHIRASSTTDGTPKKNVDPGMGISLLPGWGTRRDPRHCYQVTRMRTIYAEWDKTRIDLAEQVLQAESGAVCSSSKSSMFLPPFGPWGLQETHLDAARSLVLLEYVTPSTSSSSSTEARTVLYVRAIVAMAGTTDHSMTAETDTVVELLSYSVVELPISYPSGDSGAPLLRRSRHLHAKLTQQQQQTGLIPGFGVTSVVLLYDGSVVLTSFSSSTSSTRKEDHNTDIQQCGVHLSHGLFPATDKATDILATVTLRGDLLLGASSAAAAVHVDPQQPSSSSSSQRGSGPYRGHLTILLTVMTKGRKVLFLDALQPKILGMTSLVELPAQHHTQNNNSNNNTLLSHASNCVCESVWDQQASVALTTAEIANWKTQTIFASTLKDPHQTHEQDSHSFWTRTAFIHPAGALADQNAVDEGTNVHAPAVNLAPFLLHVDDRRRLPHPLDPAVFRLHADENRETVLDIRFETLTLPCVVTIAVLNRVEGTVPVFLKLQFSILCSDAAAPMALAENERDEEDAAESAATSPQPSRRPVRHAKCQWELRLTDGDISGRNSPNDRVIIQGALQLELQSSAITSVSSSGQDGDLVQVEDLGLRFTLPSWQPSQRKWQCDPALLLPASLALDDEDDHDKKKEGLEEELDDEDPIVLSSTTIDAVRTTTDDDSAERGPADDQTTRHNDDDAKGGVSPSASGTVLEPTLLVDGCAIQVHVGVGAVSSANSIVTVAEVSLKKLSRDATETPNESTSPHCCFFTSNLNFATPIDDDGPTSSTRNIDALFSKTCNKWLETQRMKQQQLQQQGSKKGSSSSSSGPLVSTTQFCYLVPQRQFLLVTQHVGRDVRLERYRIGSLFQTVVKDSAQILLYSQLASPSPPTQAEATGGDFALLPRTLSVAGWLRPSTSAPSKPASTSSSSASASLLGLHNGRSGPMFLLKWTTITFADEIVFTECGTIQESTKVARQALLLFVAAVTTTEKAAGGGAVVEIFLITVDPDHWRMLCPVVRLPFVHHVEAGDDHRNHSTAAPSSAATHPDHQHSFLSQQLFALRESFKVIPPIVVDGDVHCYVQLLRQTPSSHQTDRLVGTGSSLVHIVLTTGVFQTCENDNNHVCSATSKTTTSSHQSETANKKTKQNTKKTSAATSLDLSVNGIVTPSCSWEGRFASAALLPLQDAFACTSGGGGALTKWGTAVCLPGLPPPPSSTSAAQREQGIFKRFVTASYDSQLAQVEEKRFRAIRQETCDDMLERILAPVERQQQQQQQRLGGKGGDADAKRRELLGAHYKEGAASAAGKDPHQMNETKNMMNENLQLLHERGEKIDRMQNKAQLLNAETQQFADLCRQLKQKKRSSWF